MWLVGVVVRRYIDFLILLIPTPLVSVLFCSSIPTFCSCFNKYNNNNNNNNNNSNNNNSNNNNNNNNNNNSNNNNNNNSNNNNSNNSSNNNNNNSNNNNNHRVGTVDSISRDERDAPLMQYITNAGITRARYTITNFKHHHRVLQLISNQMSV